MTATRKGTASTYLVLELDRGNTYRDPRVVSHRKTKPALEPGQIAIKVEIKIPMSLFETFIPVVGAEITDPGQVLMPEITITEES